LCFFIRIFDKKKASEYERRDHAVDSYLEKEQCATGNGSRIRHTVYFPASSLQTYMPRNRLSWGPIVVISNCQLRKLVSLEHGPESVKHFQHVAC
jgi:hypothetical protein